MIHSRGLFFMAFLLSAVVACGSEDPGSLSGARRSLGRASGGSTAEQGDGRPASGSSAPGTGAATGNGGAGAGGGTGAGGGSGGASPAGVQQTCVDSINAFRAEKGLTPLQRWTAQETCASDESQKDSQSGRAHGAFGACEEMAQNECPGWEGPADAMIKGCLKAMWGEGPGGGHYENMSSTDYTQVSCGFFTTPGGQIWSVQNFR